MLLTGTTAQSWAGIIPSLADHERGKALRETLRATTATARDRDARALRDLAKIAYAWPMALGLDGDGLALDNESARGWVDGAALVADWGRVPNNLRLPWAFRLADEPQRALRESDAVSVHPHAVPRAASNTLTFATVGVGPSASAVSVSSTDGVVYEVGAEEALVEAVGGASGTADEAREVLEELAEAEARAVVELRRATWNAQRVAFIRTLNVARPSETRWPVAATASRAVVAANVAVAAALPLLRFPELALERMRSGGGGGGGGEGVGRQSPESVGQFPPPDTWSDSAVLENPFGVAFPA